MKTCCIVLASVVAATGCATSFTVKQVLLCEDASQPCAGVPPNRAAALDEPKGILVNARALYRIDASWLASDGSVARFEPSQKIGVDQRRVLQVNMCREPFADGDLALELNESQQIKSLSLDGTTHAADLLGAVQKSLETKQEIEAANKAENGVP